MNRPCIISNSFIDLSGSFMFFSSLFMLQYQLDFFVFLMARFVNATYLSIVEYIIARNPLTAASFSLCSVYTFYRICLVVRVASTKYDRLFSFCVIEGFVVSSSHLQGSGVPSVDPSTTAGCIAHIFRWALCDMFDRERAVAYT